MNGTETKCTFTGVYQSEGDGVRMKNYCVLHPDFLWYTDTWPTSIEIVERQELHRAQLEIKEFEEQKASDARGAGEE